MGDARTTSRPWSTVAHVGVATAVLAAAAGTLLAVGDREVCGYGWAAPSETAREACAVVTADGRSPVVLVALLSTGVAAAAIASLILRRRSGPIGWLLLAFGLSLTVGPAAGSYELHALAVDRDWPGAAAAGWLELAIFNNPALFAPVAVMLLLFPTGHLLSRRWAPAVVIVTAGGLLALAGVMVEPVRGTRLQEGPGGVLLAVSDIIEIPALPMLGFGLVAGLVSIVKRVRRADRAERAQLRPLVVAGVTLAAVVALAPVAFQVEWLWPAWGLAVAAASAVLPVAIGVAIIGHGLYGLDRLINRTAVYAVMSVIVVGLYITAVTAIGRALGQNEERLGALVVTGLVAIGIQPLRALIERGVERTLYGHRSEPHVVAAAVGRGMEGAEGEQSLLGAIAEATASSLRLPYVEVVADDDAIEPGASARGITDSERTTLVPMPLVHRGSRVGTLRCLPRSVGPGLDPADENVLSVLAPTLAAAVHATALAAALERSRDRLVEAQETEQRRIRRDLHDGLGPALTGVGLAIGELEHRAKGGDAAKLRRLGDEIHRSLAEIRRIAHDLHPIALSEHGLLGALGVHAERFSALGLDVRIEAAGEPPAPSSTLERSIYRIISEAITNVHRHAQARHCTVRLRFGAEVEIEVIDDGKGITATRRGVGLTSLQERVDELQGRCSVEPFADGGTRVHVVVPGRAT